MFAKRCPRCKSLRIQQGFNDSPLALRLVGIRELLCNNCNLEFKGFALPWTLNRTRSSKADAAEKRRRAPRLKAQLPVSTSLMDVDPVSRGVRYTPELQGQTREISAVGLSFILPKIHDQERAYTDSGRRLRIKLQLPTGPIYLHIAPSFSEKLDGKSAKGWLIAGSITKISTEDRARYLKYLETLGQSQEKL